MSDIADRYRRVAGQFTARARQVPEGRWDDPAPCEGWVARDVVRHLVDWMPGLFLAGPGLPVPAGPAVDDDPVGAWLAVSDAIQAALDDPAVAATTFDSRGERITVEDAVDRFGTSDVLVHTWDLARATGLDETLDPAEVGRLLAAALPYDEAMRRSGHYGAWVPVPDDADDQTRLIAFMGRRP